MDKRLHYLYLIAALYVLLSCCCTMESLWGAPLSLGVGAILILATWGAVWMRLYRMGSGHPEFSILAIVPFGFYFIVKLMAAQSPEAAEPFATPFWQNIHFFTWMAATGAIIYTLRPGFREERRPWRQDPVFILMAILSLIYGLAMWSRCTADLFPQLIH